MKKLLDLISEEVTKAFVECGYDEKYGKVTLSNRPDLCEYQCNGAMAGAKKYKCAPIAIANAVAEKLNESKVFSAANAVMPGFLNMNLSEELKKFSEIVTFREFTEKLVPDTKYPMLGVRVPKIRKIAKNAVKNGVAESFIKEKHVFYEEYFLHGLILGNLKTNFDTLLIEIENFLPYIDNWAICDSTVSSFKIFKKHKAEVFEKIKVWIKSKNPYTVRFAIVTLLWYFIDEEYLDKAITLVKNAYCEHYYVNMAIAWFFSVSLAKYYDNTLHIIEGKELPLFVHNKTIQKCIESFRITDKQKQYLKTLKK
jgi:3-methyladenine DNA glycosylase AlkD